MIIQYRRDIEYSSKKTLDIYYRKNEINELKPVVIHIYGESWYKGNISITSFFI